MNKVTKYLFTLTTTKYVFIIVFFAVIFSEILVLFQSYWLTGTFFDVNILTIGFVTPLIDSLIVAFLSLHLMKYLKRDITIMQETTQLKSDHQAQIIEQIHDSVNSTDMDGFITSWNKASEIIFGYRADEIIGKHISLLHLKKNLTLFEDAKESFMTTGEYRVEIELLKKSQETIYASLTLSLLKDENGKPTNIVGYVQDITQRKNIEHSLLEKHKTLEESQRIAHIGSWKLNLRTNKLSWSNEIYHIFEIDLNTEASYELFIQGVHPEDRDIVDRAYNTSIQDKKAYTIVHRLLFKNGRIKYVKEQSETSFDDNGNPLISIGTIQDITEQKLLEDKLLKQQKALKHLATHDPLTELPNRALFNDRLMQASKIAKREKGKFALLFLDLDSFKEINDTLGHDVGDEVLKVVAKKLKRAMREEDTLARLGGDEFIIIMRDIVQAKDASLLAQKILESVAEPMLIDENTLSVSSSIGISVYPEDSALPENILKYSDLAMYKAKSKGKNTFHFYAT